MFVDVAPPAPPTFTALSEAEVEALRDAEDEPVASRHDEDEATQSPDDDESSVELGDWRAARQRVGRTRIPPGQRAKPQAA